jgi:hypothetical protein
MSNEEVVAFLRKNVIPVVCVLVSIAIAITLYYRSDVLPDAEKVLAQKTQQGVLLAANIEDANQPPSLKDQHAAIVASNEAITARMVKVGQLAENLQYFYQLESATGAKLTPVQIPVPTLDKKAPKTFFTPVEFTLSAQGDYAQLIDMLRRLEEGEHYCRVLTCNFRPVATDMRGGPMLMTLSLQLLGTE